MNLIETQGLTRTYRKSDALRDLNLTVSEGTILGYLGPNGAGKTTTIKLLMNLIAPSSGHATVLGVDSRKLSPREFQSIGYVSENQELPEWMTVDQFLGFCREQYPKWDRDLEKKLMDQFALPKDKKLRELSRGMQMKAALISSLAYRPRLLVMDEPFSGLDPLVRDELIQGLLELSDRGDWTIFLSSHDLDEVERLADRVAIVNAGRLLLEEPTEQLQRRFRKIEVVRNHEGPPPLALPPSWLQVEAAGRLLRWVDSEYLAESTEIDIRARVDGVESLTVETVTLKEIFRTLAKTHRVNL